MAREISVTVHEIATDGLPPEEGAGGRVAFIFDGCVVSGWPLRDGTDHWEADSDVGRHEPFGNVTHWLEFPAPLWEIAPRGARQR